MLRSVGFWQAMMGKSTVERWYRVAYTRKSKSALVYQLVVWARQRYKQAEDEFASIPPSHSDPDDVGSEIGHDLRVDLAAAVDLASALMKPKGFRAEREVRAVASAVVPSELVSYRANDELVIRFLRLAVALPTHTSPDAELVDVKDPKTGLPARLLPVIGLTIGPGARFQEVEHTVTSLLRSAAITSPTICRSKVPMRW